MSGSLTLALAAAERIVTAAQSVAQIDSEAWGDIGPHLSCDEHDRIVELLTAVGATLSASYLRSGHAESDDWGDAHHDHRGDCDPDPESECAKELPF